MAEGKRENKRNLPPWMLQILHWDVVMTKKAFDAFDQKFGYEKYQKELKYLEISCHGLIWIIACVAFLYFGFSPELWMNLLTLQILDIILIAVIKAFVRRKRPVYNQNDMVFTHGPDQFSFPSGHASRGFVVAFFFLGLYRLNLILNIPIMIWAISTAVSRVCLGRHHILDVIGGFGLAVIEYGLMATLVYMDQDKARTWAALIANSEDPWSSG